MPQTKQTHDPGVAVVRLHLAADGRDPDEVELGGDEGEVPEGGVVEGKSEVGDYRLRSDQADR